jgi:glycosyltransferase involved in cell wall biosynthesis
MAPPLRLLMATPRFLPATGGVEIHVYQVARRLVAAGHAVTVLTTDPGGQLPAEEEIEGIQVRRVPAWPTQSDLYFAPALVPLIERGDWDLVHCQSYHSLVPPLAMWAARRAGRPYVVTFHGGGHSSRLRHALRGAQRALLRPLLARANRLVALAEFEIEEYGKALRLPRQRFVLIPNGTDPMPVDRPPPVAGALIASVGRLERYKGHHRILAALPAILRERPDARLWIAGAGPYEPDLRRLALRLGVADKVDIRAIPPGNRRGMAEALSQAALVTLLSDFETHPLAALEAIALGRPVLVTDGSGMAELARRGLARAIPPGSRPEQIAAAVLDSLRRPAPPPPVALPTWDDCAAGLLTLYRSIIRRPACVS